MAFTCFDNALLQEFEQQISMEYVSSLVQEPPAKKIKNNSGSSTPVTDHSKLPLSHSPLQNGNGTYLHSSSHFDIPPSFPQPPPASSPQPLLHSFPQPLLHLSPQSPLHSFPQPPPASSPQPPFTHSLNHPFAYSLNHPVSFPQPPLRLLPPHLPLNHSFTHPLSRPLDHPLHL